jgi:hypothetical protein
MTLSLLWNDLLIASNALYKLICPPTSHSSLTLSGHYITVSWSPSALKASQFIQYSKICAVMWMPMVIFCIYICNLHQSSLLSVVLWLINNLSLSVLSPAAGLFSKNSFSPVVLIFVGLSMTIASTFDKCSLFTMRPFWHIFSIPKTSVVKSPWLVMLLACFMNFYITFFKLFVPIEIVVLLEQRSRHSTALSSDSAGIRNISLLLYHSRSMTFKLNSVMPALSLSVLQMHSRSFQVSLLQLSYVLKSHHMLVATQVSFALSLSIHRQSPSVPIQCAPPLVCFSKPPTLNRALLHQCFAHCSDDVLDTMC